MVAPGTTAPISKIIGNWIRQHSREASGPIVVIKGVLLGRTAAVRRTGNQQIDESIIIIIGPRASGPASWIIHNRVRHDFSKRRINFEMRLLTRAGACEIADYNIIIPFVSYLNVRE